MRIRLGLLVPLTLVALLGGAFRQRLAGQEPQTRARITYVTSTTAYFDAGREDGLEEGMDAEVVRGGLRIGVLRVNYLASHRAAAAIIRVDSVLIVGDTVVFTPRAREPSATGKPAAPGIRSRSNRSTGAGRLRGRLGLRYLFFKPVMGSGYTQPALDLRLDGSSLGGSPVGVRLDMRARQRLRKQNDGTTVKDVRTAVYQAAVTLRAAGGQQLTVGRQYLPTVGSVSLFDGALASIQRSRLGAGAFIGSEPDPSTMGYSTDIRSYGVYVEGRNAPGAATRWSLAGGAVGSYASGTVNREFGFLQASVNTPVLTLFAVQEVDLNRAWKAEAGDPSVTWTSTFATVMLRPTPWLNFQGGVDNRRNVRLYRDLVDPETEFDDSFRRGVWGGGSVLIGRHTRVGADLRRTLGGSEPATSTSSLNTYANVDRLTPLNLSIRGRYNQYRAVERTGSLQSLGLRIRPAAWMGLEASGGRRQESVGPEAEGRQMSWYALDLDVALGRSVYFLFSGSREQGSLAAGDQVFLSFSYRF